MALRHVARCEHVTESTGLRWTRLHRKSRASSNMFSGHKYLREFRLCSCCPESMRVSLFRSIGCGWILFGWAAGWVGASEGPLWRRYQDPAFPPQLLSTPVRDGFATVVFTFDANGRITDRVALEESHPSFVQSIGEASQGWEIDPRQNEPLSRREVVRFNFQRQGSVISLNQREATKALFDPHIDQAASRLPTCREAELGSTLIALASVMPTYSAPLGTQQLRGRVTVSFIVDTGGQVRVPAVTNGSDQQLGEAALRAIQQWRFQPAQQKGKPVQVIAERTLRFGPAGEPN